MQFHANRQISRRIYVLNINGSSFQQIQRGGLLIIDGMELNERTIMQYANRLSDT